MNRRPVVAALVIGLALAAAPVAFQMFDRAPKGGRMISSFKPFMTEAKIDRFRGYLAEIGRAEAEANASVTARAGDATAAAAQYPSTVALHEKWPGIDHDMNDMLATMRGDLDAYDGMKALPPFALFPWFFVLPGLCVAAVAATALWRKSRGLPTKVTLRILAAFGVMIVAAPAVFQLFTRAPAGQRMIADFAPMMKASRVTTVQGYFLTLGAAEGELRVKVVPAAEPTALTAVRQWNTDWPKISNEMAPMIGAMADNLGNFAAVKAMPPFGLFPWFFVIPGLLVFGLAVNAGVRRRVVDLAVVDLTKLPQRGLATVNTREGSAR